MIKNLVSATRFLMKHKNVITAILRLRREGRAKAGSNFMNTNGEKLENSHPFLRNSEERLNVMRKIKIITIHTIRIAKSLTFYNSKLSRYINKLSWAGLG